jgi:8-oxo-dGTP pyrophosphatase MutT (NUDIX family)
LTEDIRRVEHLDVFDEVGRHIGVKDRAAVHRDGDWHRVFHCLIVAERPGAGAVAVLQLRGATKAAFGGLLDLTAAGHLEAGESPLDGIRELEEELGIHVDPADLVALGTRRLIDESGEGRLNRELTHVFLLRDDRPLSDYSPAVVEVDGLLDVPIDGLLGVFDSDATLDVSGIAVEADGATTPIRRTIGEADLVPNRGYWITLLVMAQRHLAGQLPLAI